MRLYFRLRPVPLASRLAICSVLAGLCAIPSVAAEKKPAPAPDVLVLSNGDTLHGKLVSETSGKVTFHSDALGDISIPWAKIKELHAAGAYAVFNAKTKPVNKQSLGKIPVGSLDVTNQAVTVRPANAEPPPPIPVKEAEYIMEDATLNKDLSRHPGFRSGWAGAATAGATLVTATQSQYTLSGAVALARTVPDVSWLDTRNRTSVGFNGSFGKITQPAYTVPATGTTPATLVPSTATKTAIYHADAERDEYFSPRLFVLAQTVFDHNFSQDLNLQQIYGGGLGWTALKTPRQNADLKATVQYEKQQFISGASGTNQNLIGSTLAANYALHLKRVNWTQALAFIPAFNNAGAYSATEADTFAFPAYKNLSFSLGTLDSYLNDPPVALPPTKRNSFQFTMGLTYAIKPRH
ncbi:MAG: DUF481 domain-containing protein [Terracidiphilus sp.]